MEEKLGLEIAVEIQSGGGKTEVICILVLAEEPPENPSPTKGFIRTNTSGTISIGAMGASYSPMPFIGDRWHCRSIAKPNTLDPCSCLCGVPQRSSQPLQPRTRPSSAKPLSAAILREMSIRRVLSVAACLDRILAMDQRHRTLHDTCSKPDQRLEATSPDHRDHGIPVGALVDRGRNHLIWRPWLASAHHCCSAPRSAPPRAMPADPCPESILIKAAGQAYLLEGRAMVIMDEAFSPLVV